MPPPPVTRTRAFTTTPLSSTQPSRISCRQTGTLTASEARMQIHQLDLTIDSLQKTIIDTQHIIAECLHSPFPETDQYLKPYHDKIARLPGRIRIHESTRMYYVKLLEKGLPENDVLVKVPMAGEKQRVQVWGFPAEKRECWKVGMMCLTW